MTRVKFVKVEDKPSHRIPAMRKSWLNDMEEDGWELIFTNNGKMYFKQMSDKKFPCYFSPAFFDELNKAKA